jgi:hypothetical protein
MKRSLQALILSLAVVANSNCAREVTMMEKLEQMMRDDATLINSVIYSSEQDISKASNATRKSDYLNRAIDRLEPIDDAREIRQELASIVGSENYTQQKSNLAGINQMLGGLRQEYQKIADNYKVTHQ